MATLTDAQLADLREKAKVAQSNRAALDVVRALNPKVADWLAAADPQTVLALIERLREAEAQIGEEVTPKPEPEPEQPTVSCDDLTSDDIQAAHYDQLKPWPHTRFQGRDVLRGPEPEVTG